MSTEKQKTNQSGRIITIVIGVLLLGGMGFFATKYFQEKNKNVEAQTNLDDLTVEIEDLELDLDNYRAELEDANLDIEDKQKLLAEKEQELLEKQKKIDRLLRDNKITKEEASKLRTKIEQLNFYIAKYQKTIEEQKKEIAALSQDKEYLTSKVKDLDKEMGAMEMDKIEAETKLKSAGILQVVNFKFYRVKNSGKEVEDTEFRKGRIDELKLCFTAVGTSASKAGPREFFLQLIGPDGKIIKDSGKQSGFFTHYDKETPYSVKKNVDFNNNTMEICTNFLQPENHDYEKGIHKVIVYSETYELGSGTFEVK